MLHVGYLECVRVRVEQQVGHAVLVVVAVGKTTRVGGSGVAARWCVFGVG